MNIYTALRDTAEFIAIRGIEPLQVRASEGEATVQVSYEDFAKLADGRCVRVDRGGAYNHYDCDFGTVTVRAVKQREEEHEAHTIEYFNPACA